METELAEQSRRESEYRQALSAAARAFWLELVSFDGFFQAMMAAIERGLTWAWEEGAAECGIKPDEFTAEERLELRQAIFDQYNYIAGFGQFIEQNLKSAGGKWGSIINRIEMWANKYRAVRGKAASLACANKKKKFVKLGVSKESCRSCLGLENRVYRYETWEINDAIPPSKAFDCGGYHCPHGLIDTDERITPGPFPRSLLAH